MNHPVICSYLVILAFGGAVFFLGEAANFPVSAQQDVSGNLTVADIERLRDNMNDAREAIHNDDTEEALGSLGFANSTTLEVINMQQASGGAVVDQLNSLLTDINDGLNAIRNNDSALALNEIGDAESQLFRLSATLPPMGTPEEDVAEEPEAPAADTDTPEQNLESLQDAINEARDAIHNNDLSGALEILNGTQGVFSQ
jgi:DNA repair ATPase RecN